MMQVRLVTSPHADDARWTEAVATVLGDVAAVEVVRLDGLSRSATALDRPGPVVVTGFDDAVLRWIGSCCNVVLAPAPWAVDRLRGTARSGGSRLRVLSLTAACHAAAQRAGLRSAYFQYFPDPAAAAVRQSSTAAPAVYSFLDRMARGDIVMESGPLACDSIVDGVNGFTQSPDSVPSTDEASRIAAAARMTVAHGFARWRLDHDRLRGYLAGFPAEGMACGYAHALEAPVVRRSPVAATPVVTIATVVRNAAADLRHTLRSTCGQRFPDREVVVFDGGSTDGTLDVIREFAPHIDQWSSATDNGPYDAMQKAAAAARGRWILFMNAGDRFVDTDALGRLVEAACDDADVVAGHHVYIDSKGIESINHCVDFETTYARLLAGDLDSAWIRGVPCHQAVLTRAELIRRHGFDPSYRIAADHEFMYRMRRAGAVFQVVPTIVAEYVGGGLSARQEFRCLEEWRRIAHAYSRDRQRADRSLDQMLVMAMKAQRRRGPFDFSQEPAHSRPLLAAQLDLAYRLKSAFRRNRPG